MLYSSLLLNSQMQPHPIRHMNNLPKLKSRAKWNDRKRIFTAYIVHIPSLQLIFRPVSYYSLVQCATPLIRRASSQRTKTVSPLTKWKSEDKGRGIALAHAAPVSRFIAQIFFSLTTRLTACCEPNKSPVWVISSSPLIPVVVSCRKIENSRHARMSQPFRIHFRSKECGISVESHGALILNKAEIKKQVGIGVR